ncbi:hypothetical protein JST97_21680 [bacterium]|nr:hypothetical protein [bacterium]
MKRVCLVLALTGSLWAQPDGRKPIEDFYAGLSMASELKFAEGMASHRTSDYQGIDALGRRSDRWSELYRYRDLFHRSLSVRLTNRILRFSQKGPTCRCLVEQRWEITRAGDKPPQTVLVQELKTVEDVWVWQNEWKLRRSVSQNAGLPRHR